MKWIGLIFLLALVHGSNEHSCPAITTTPLAYANNLSSNRLRKVIQTNTNLAATVVDIDEKKWLRGETSDGKYEIPYAFKDDITPNAKEAAYFGMVIIERGTNIIFVQKRPDDINYVLIQGSKAGCFSSVGDENDGPQELNLDAGCASAEHATHELLHAVGLHHEHQRMDRPDMPGEYFNKGDQNAPRRDVKGMTQYDPFSIMHYPAEPNIPEYEKHGWSNFELFLLQIRRAFPSPCDFYAVNELYPGLRQGPSCTDVKIHPMNLHATNEGKRMWARRHPNSKIDINFMCNWGSEYPVGGKRLFSYNRSERQFCQLENNRMYPDLSWIPNAASKTIPLHGIDYSDYAVTPSRNEQEYPPQHMCDCLPPSLGEVGFTDNSMFQTCLECVHFESTTDGVLRCIADSTYYSEDVYRYLTENYPNNYYTSGPQ